MALKKPKTNHVVHPGSNPGPALHGHMPMKPVAPVSSADAAKARLDANKRIKAHGKR